ncbi:Myb domain protein 62 [Tanacetum coccineum]
MENLYREDHQEHEVNSPQTNTVTSAPHQENIASNSNGTTITRKESRALSANRKSKFNQRKLVFEIDDCAGRIVGDDSQTFITKGGCVEHSDFKSTCPLMARAIKTQLASHHRTKQYILHKHYLRYPTKEEATTHPPNGVKVAEWVLLCDRFASEEFQIPPLIFGLKISATNKHNRACNEVPPTVGTKSVARRIHEKRKRGEEVTAIGGYKIAHYSKKKKAMINDKANKIWLDLQNEEASSSCTPAEICIEKLGHIPGHIRGRSASTKHVFETESLRMDLNSEKEKSKQLEKDHLELKENHLKLQKEHVSLTKKVDYLLKHFTAWQSQENEDYDSEDYDEAQDDGIKDHKYHVDALYGIHHWEDKRKYFYKAEMGNRSPHKVYSNKRIITVTSVNVKSKWGYGFLTSIVVKRIDGKEYEFNEADLSRLIVIKNQIEDTQLGMESYECTMNFTKGTFYTAGIDLKIPYTTIRPDKGVMYLNKHNVKSLMLHEEVYKFCDGTLMKVRDHLKKLLNENRLGCGNKNLKGIDWTVKDIKRSEAMLEKIEKTFKHR